MGAVYGIAFPAFFYPAIRRYQDKKWYGFYSVTSCNACQSLPVAEVVP